jgi:regulator of sigma E protease
MSFVSILVAIAVFAVLVIVHEFGHFIVAKRSGVRVDEFAIGFPPRLWSVKRGETRYSINALPLGGYVLMPGENGQMLDEKGNVDPRTFAAQPASKRAAILVAGVTMNLILAWFIYMGLFAATGIALDPAHSPAVVGLIEKGTPAEQALKIGDHIISVNGVTVTNVQDTQAAIKNAVKNDHSAKDVNDVPITLIVVRDGKQKTLQVNARRNPPPNQGQIGFGFQQQFNHISAIQLPGAALNQVFVGNFQLVGEGIHQVLVGAIKPQDAVTGPVGIVQVISTASSIADLFYLMAFLSWNLAVFNLLPIPGLDGGRLLLVGVEVLRRGRRLAPEREALINLVGLGFLLSLILVFTVNDILRIVNGQ